MMRDYNVPPFQCEPMDYPTWWEDDLLYFELQDFLANLPYYVRDIDKYIQQATKT